MAATSSDSDAQPVILLRGNVELNRRVWTKLLDIEARDCAFELLAEERIRVRPAGRLTPEDVSFLRRHRNEVIRVIEYRADDLHLRRT